MNATEIKNKIRSEFKDRVGLFKTKDDAQFYKNKSENIINKITVKHIREYQDVFISDDIMIECIVKNRKIIKEDLTIDIDFIRDIQPRTNLQIMKDRYYN